jgi:hypothetical protein
MSAHCSNCGGDYPNPCEVVNGTCFGGGAVQEVFVAFTGAVRVYKFTVAAMLAADDFGEFAAVLPHIQRGEVCMIGGGAAQLACVWMDTTGDGNDITDVARAFAVARGEVSR